MARPRLSHEDAMTLWRTRDIYRVQAALRGLLLLFFVVEFVGYCTFGYWWLGLLAIAVQLGLLWCLRWGLRWVRRWLWWCINHGHMTLLTWWRERRR